MLPISKTWAAVGLLLLGAKCSGANALLNARHPWDNIPHGHATNHGPLSAIVSTELTRTTYTTVLDPETSTDTEYTTVIDPETSTSTEYTTVIVPETNINTEYTTVIIPETSTNTEYTTVILPETSTNTEYTTLIVPETSTNVEYTTLIVPETSTITTTSVIVVVATYTTYLTHQTVYTVDTTTTATTTDIVSKTVIVTSEYMFSSTTSVYNPCPTTCSISAGTVNLFYWPTSNGFAYPTTFVNTALDYTFTSPSVYMIVNTIQGYNSVGPTPPSAANIIFALDLDEVSTLVLDGSSATRQLSLSDLGTDCPQTADPSVIATMTPNSRCDPILLAPDKVKSWASPCNACGRFGLFDPPYAIPTVTGSLLPSVTSIVPTTPIPTITSTATATPISPVTTVASTTSSTLVPVQTAAAARGMRGVSNIFLGLCVVGILI